MPAIITQQGGFAALGGTVAMKVFTWQSGQLGINDIIFSYTQSAAGTVTYGALAKAFCDLVSAPYQNWLSSAALFLGVKCQPLQPDPSSASGIASDQLPGSSMGEPLPGQAAAIIRWTTVFSGPSNRSRIFVPFPTEANSDGPSGPNNAGLILLNAIEAVINGFTTVVIGASTFSFDHVVYHRATGTATPTNSSSTGGRWATQRRRGAYGKVNPPFIS